MVFSGGAGDEGDDGAWPRSAEEVLRPRFLLARHRAALRGRAPRRSRRNRKPAISNRRSIASSCGTACAQQIMLLVLTLVSFPFLYYSLNLPKTIINRAIHGHHFPEEFLGFQFDQVPYLMLLCAMFLTLVLINGGFKYCINTLKGQLGERMLRRFRYQLYQRLLRFPPSYFQKTSSAQIIPMITVECEPLGGFIGDAFVQPAVPGRQLLTIIFFMFMQDPILGIAAIALYPVQGYVIPKLQAKVNQLMKRRVRTVRQVADRVQESAAGIVEIHANDTVKLQLTDFAHVLGMIYDIRFEIYQRKFFVKFLNNFIGQLTPFFFLLDRRLSGHPGQPVVRRAGGDPRRLQGSGLAVEGAARLLPDQGKFADHLRADRRAVPAGRHGRRQAAARGTRDRGAADRRNRGRQPVARRGRQEPGRRRGQLYRRGSTEHVAIIGQSGSGKSELALLLARLVQPTGGRITIGGTDIADLPIAVIGRRIGYVGSTPYLFSGTLRDNLLLGLRHRPVRPAEYDEAAARRRARQLARGAQLRQHRFRSARRLDRLRKRRGIRPRGADAAHRRGAGAARLRGGCLHPRAARPARSGGAPGGRRAPARSPQGAGPTAGRATASPSWSRPTTSSATTRTPRSPKTCCSAPRSGRLSISSSLAENTYVLQRARQGRADRRSGRGRPAGRRDDDRDVRRPAARARILRAVQLHQRRRSARIRRHPGGSRKRRHEGAAAASSASKLLSLPFKLIAARHRLDVLDERDAAAAARSAPRLPQRAAGRGARPDRVFRRRPLQRRRLAAGQHPVRQDRLWRGRRGDAGAAGPRRGAGRAVAARRRSSMSGSITMSAPPVRACRRRSASARRSRGRC